MQKQRRYPDHATVKNTLALGEFLRQSHKRASWNKTVNLLAVAILTILVVLAIWLFWPQIAGLINQFLSWRQSVNIKVGP